MFVNSADSLVAIFARSSSWTTVKPNPASNVCISSAVNDDRKGSPKKPKKNPTIYRMMDGEIYKTTSRLPGAERTHRDAHRDLASSRRNRGIATARLKGQL